MSTIFVRLAGCSLVVAGMLVGVVAFGQDKRAGKKTTFRLLLPKNKAKVWINGVRTNGEGKKREIAAPPLAKGKKFHEITVSWRTNNYTKFFRSKKVAPKPGAVVVVDMRTAYPKTPDRIKIRYVPTPHLIVARMCRMAGVGKEDVVYDLGCGDGRIVISAVGDFHAKRGVGVDINPKLVKKSRENAKQRKLNGKVEFRVGDVLNIKDLSDASVVMLYMGEDVNMRLRPILKKTLKPGARIVSHAFGMGDWKADQTDIIQDNDGEYYVLYMWTIGKR